MKNPFLKASSERARPHPAITSCTLALLLISVALFNICTSHVQLAQHRNYPAPPTSEVGAPSDQLMELNSSHIEHATVPLLPRMARPTPFPSLTEMRHDNGTITGNVSWLLDFAVIGFAKCGTSTMMQYLNQPPLSFVIQNERCEVAFGNSGRTLVPDLYHIAQNFEANRTSTLIGIKCPRNIHDRMDIYPAHYPTTKLIMGVRHPVLWFQSFYNFAVNNMGALPHPNKLMRGYIYGSKGVYADRGRYHYYLARLGKTPLKDERELSLVFSAAGAGEKRKFFTKYVIKDAGQKLFLFDVDQLSKHGNETLSSIFAKDLSNFLGLDQSLNPAIHHYSPGRKYTKERQAAHDAMKINICDDEFQELRNVLMGHGRSASQWIREYFLQSPDVFVSSRWYFEKVIDRWSEDPCESKEQAATNVTSLYL